jgi:hypothetical protein
MFALVTDERLVEFRYNNARTTLHITEDGEFTAYSIMQLMAFFPGKFSKRDFWPELAADA